MSTFDTEENLYEAEPALIRVQRMDNLDPEEGEWLEFRIEFLNLHRGILTRHIKRGDERTFFSYGEDFFEFEFFEDILLNDGGETNHTFRRFVGSRRNFARTTREFGIEARVGISEGIRKFSEQKFDTTLEKQGYIAASGVIEGKIREALIPTAVLLAELNQSRRVPGLPAFWQYGGSVENGGTPYVLNDGFQCNIISGLRGEIIEFWRIGIKGNFFSIRGLQDDYERMPSDPKVLDPFLAVNRTFDILEPMLHFAKRLAESLEKATLHVHLEWGGIRNRHLTSWSHPSRAIRGTNLVCVQRKFDRGFSIPVSADSSALVAGITDVVRSLSACFGGFDLPENVIQVQIQQYIEESK